tara:strand:+ start:51 stop:992 length:942 start_codon:yes stop_codon:yes gene_type:complete
MANPIIGGTTYAGQFASKYISAALLSASTIENGGVTVLPNVKFKEVLQNLSTSALMANATCDFDAAGSTVTLSEKVLTTSDLQVNMQLCRSQFFNTWESIQMGASAHSDIPKTFEDYLLGYVGSKIASEMETTLWAGAAGAAGGFTDGGLTVLAAAQAPGANQIAAAAVTAANVIDELGKVVDAINAQTNIYGYEDTRIFVSRNVMAAYVRALGGFAATGANGVDNRGTMWYADGGGVSFDGIKLFMAEGLPSNTMLAAQISNLYLGVSLLSDLSEAKVVPVHLYDGSDNVRVIYRMAAGAQIGVASDVILYA